MSHISNFTDFDALQHESEVELDYIDSGTPLAGYNLIILPGSKNTLADLSQLQETGFADRLAAYVAAGGAVIGICGGFQMLGSNLLDPQKIESAMGELAGFGLLPMITEMAPEKVTVQCRAQVESKCFGSSLHVSGYEIHQGRTVAQDNALATMLNVTQADGTEYKDGFISADGRIWGSYMHGIFDDDNFRNAYLGWLRQYSSGFDATGDVPPVGISYKQRKEDGFSALADLLAKSLDMKMIDQIAGL
ncbi:MAG: hypothetical protein DRH03_01615 [Deltaproteobacteria bacterium]|nr:MAG: hypothetical protein DRH03_01615 [Deltaproteobacteria bacterium]